MKLYGQKGNPWFGEILEGDNCYRVLVRTSESERKAFYPTIDDCIMWAARLFAYDHIQVQSVEVYSPTGKEVKKYESTDCLLEDLWLTLTDVPMNPDTEEMEEDWFTFEAGTFREDIWHWFDAYHSKGVGWIINEVEE